MSAPKSAEIAKGDEGRLMCSIGFIGLVIESTLPIPQFIANYKRKSCYGFRSSTLAGWLFGDLFKSVHFLLAAIHINLSLDNCTPICASSCILGDLGRPHRLSADIPAGPGTSLSETHLHNSK